MCLHILNDRLDDTCCKAFVDLGGFRLLKRWIRIAADENCADELNLIVNICKKLPFDEVIVRETEIGKSIKKLLKFRDDKDGSDSLKVSAQSLIELWTEEMKTIRAKTDNPKLAAEKTIVELPDDAIDLLELVNERMFTHRKLIPKLSHVPSPIVVAKEVASSAVDRSDSLILKDPLQIDVDSESTPSSARSSSDNITPTGGATLRTSFSGPSPGLSTLREKIKQEKEGKQKAGTDILALLQNKRKVSLVDPDAMDLSSTTDLSPLATLDLTDSDSTSSRRAMDASRGMELMADKAMKLLAARELAEKMRTIEDKMQVDDIDYAQIAKPKVNVVLKSCLKQKNNNIAKVETDSVLTPATAPVTAPVVKEKRSLKWADDSGGELREVRTFEVKNLKKSTASYKSHRDLVKKEKMLEKSSNISKIVEAMQPTTKWTTPKPRILSFEMQENACGPIESSDSEIQASRIAHILEARYMDDSLIPAEPDEAPSAREIATSTEGVKEIPWFISDNVFDQDDTDRIIHGYRHLQYNPSFDSSQDSAHQVMLVSILSCYVYVYVYVYSYVFTFIF